MIFSQRVMTSLINKGLSREEAYDAIQQIAMESLNKRIDFKNLLLSNELVKKYLSNEEIEASFTLDYYFKEVDEIYRRCEI